MVFYDLSSYAIPLDLYDFIWFFIIKVLSFTFLDSISFYYLVLGNL